jgi:hypothetical protein
MAPTTKRKNNCRSTSAIPDFFRTRWLIKGNINQSYKLICKGPVIGTLCARKYVSRFFKDISSKGQHLISAGSRDGCPACYSQREDDEVREKSMLLNTGLSQ